MKITQKIVVKQCLIIPMLLLAVLLFSNNSIAKDVKKVIDQEEVENVLEVAKEENTITTMLDLRKFIAYNIKYPSSAAENKVQGKVEVFVKIDEMGKVGDIVNKPTDNSAMMLEEVVAVAYLPENAKVSSSNNGMKSLEKELKRIVNKMPALEIPEYYEKTLGFTVKFVLEEK